ncbi:hypothetical protein [Leptothoe kymatousa]|uniref:hypothetical protein n=1 Tax=Leptothoe kymatousa TaxID=2651727 RepID=UPI001C02E730|nr:hypothetical protein [Leptothoe kymatousa]
MDRYGVSELPSDPAERIRLVQPWKNATGPKTELGKMISSQNRLKHGLYSKSHLFVYLARVRLEAMMLAEVQENFRLKLDAIKVRVPALGAAVEEILEQEIEASGVRIV